MLKPPGYRFMDNEGCSGEMASAALGEGADPSGHWEGEITLPGGALQVMVDLVPPAEGAAAATPYNRIPGNEPPAVG